MTLKDFVTQACNEVAQAAAIHAHNKLRDLRLEGLEWYGGTAVNFDIAVDWSPESGRVVVGSGSENSPRLTFSVCAWPIGHFGPEDGKLKADT